MSKVILQPMYFEETSSKEKNEFSAQLDILRNLYKTEAEFLTPLPVTAKIPVCDAVVFVQLIGEVFRYKEVLAGLGIPLIILTSPFGTVEMWDWEIVAYLREETGLPVYAPYTIELAQTVMRAISTKKAMKQGTRFLMFQDSPGEGKQANIFKRFYWWETECTRRIESTFGVKIIYQSWTALNKRAQDISDNDAAALWQERAVPSEDVTVKAILPAVKLYMAVREKIDEIGDVCGVGSNCLNESFHSITTPCLAWNWLFEYDGILWACEGDTVSLISKYIFYSAMKRPIMMTNIYPFLVGMAALKHEKIDRFPDISDPDNHALGVHCGYFGLAPQSFCTEWIIRPKVLEIVDDNAIVIDCRMKTGPVTLAKLHADMKKLTVIEATIDDYVQYPDSDCRNGALLRYRNQNGHRIMQGLSSHHALIIQGDITYQLAVIAQVYGFVFEVI